MILCIGEILVDLIGKKENGIITYSRYAGGAPFNVACGIAKYGGNVEFIGNVGNDLLGDFLIDFSKGINFQKTIITKDNNHNTTLAFVENDENGERSFCFYRKNTSDYQIPLTSLEEIKNANIIHFGSLMLSEESGRKIADEIIRIAKLNSKKISFDINFRDDIFKNTVDAINIYKQYASFADILKFSSDELTLFTGIDDYHEALKVIAKKDQIIFVTLGKDGSIFYQNERLIHVPSIKIKPVDTTGAGDAFFAGVLLYLDKFSTSLTTNENLIKEMLKFANISGALVATKHGAIDSIPTIDQIKKLM